METTTTTTEVVQETPPENAPVIVAPVIVTPQSESSEATTITLMEKIQTLETAMNQQQENHEREMQSLYSRLSEATAEPEPEPESEVAIPVIPEVIPLEAQPAPKKSRSGLMALFLGK